MNLIKRSFQTLKSPDTTTFRYFISKVDEFPCECYRSSVLTGRDITSSILDERTLILGSYLYLRDANDDN